MEPELRRGGVKIALAQVNVTVGDIQGNEAKIARILSQTKASKADLVVFPELALTGYPPEDLLFKRVFIQQNLAALKRLVGRTRGIAAVFGFADRDARGRLYNAAAVAVNGRLVHRYHKMELPNYGVFDEKRYFTPGKQPLVLGLPSSSPSMTLEGKLQRGSNPDSRFRGNDGRVLVGLSICEDIWVDPGPVRMEAKAGARILINLSASPYHAGKRSEREKLLIRRARSTKAWICYLNLVGGQDELVFDGGSMVVDPRGRIIFRAPQFREGLYLVEVPSMVAPATGPAAVLPVASSPSAPILSSDEEIFEALVLGTRDYVMKNQFAHAVIGLSGGIDSALTAAIAVAALGKEKVTGVSMPSRYSSPQTKADARAVAKGLGIQFLEIPIEPVFQSIIKTLLGIFKGRRPDVTEENLQARIRGTLLMALSNKFHWLVLATGNKSEISTGYCTLYGDMVGGFAVIKDLPKTWVYRLSSTANRVFGRAVIPKSVFTRPPTAELKPNQKDQDTLPPYERLDRIVRAYVEEDRSTEETRRIAKASKAEIRRVLRMIDLNEYKRRQAPIGIKITPRAFGRDRRMPITNRFAEV
ncbi:MAG: NAD+ synthase [Candidatus Omnitrophica bacterium]|nr:NAD+ synthase [Candidatus Omnitrophota bacterium]